MNRISSRISRRILLDVENQLQGDEIGTTLDGGDGPILIFSAAASAGGSAGGAGPSDR